MAQYFWSAENYAVGEVPAEFNLIRRINSIEVDSDSDGKYAAVDASGGFSRSILIFTPPGITTDTSLYVRISLSGEFYALLRFQPDSEVGITGLKSYMQRDGRTGSVVGMFNINYSALASSANTGLAAGSVGKNFFDAIGTTLLGRWANDADQLATTEAVATEATAFTEGWVGFHFWTAATYRIYEIGVGTDGDPAPTGPVGTTEAFALRHNPRTNKVIPVLSSPTVTDIGANCVRPRVTKGY